MRVIDPGHVYELDHIDGNGTQELRFVKRLIVPGRTEAFEGVTCQEVLRVLIDRVNVLDTESPWPLNAEILQHMRECIALFEARAIIQHVKKKNIKPENIAISSADGHFKLTITGE